MEASHYPVSFPFGATSPPYSTASPHKGDDYACPFNTPLKVNGLLLGYTGNTGNVEPKPTAQNPKAGAHLHVAKYLNGQYAKPTTPFSLPGATVFDTGYNASSGYYVRLKVGASSYIYCHLNTIAPLRPGQAVTSPVTGGKGAEEKKEPMIADTDNEYARWKKLSWHVRGRELSRKEFQAAAVGRPWLQAIEILEDSDEAARTQVAQETGLLAVRDNWAGQLKAKQVLADTLQGQVTELKTIADNLKADDDRDKQLINTQVMKIAALTAELQQQGAAKVTVAKPAHNWFVTLMGKVAAASSKNKA